MRQGCAFGLQPGKKLRITGLDDAIERRLFRSVAFVDVAVGTAGSKQSSQPASAWVDKAGRRRTTCLSAWAVPGWRRRARFDVGILLIGLGPDRAGRLGIGDQYGGDLESQPLACAHGSTGRTGHTDTPTAQPGPFFRAPFRNSISNAWRPTKRSNAEILASYCCRRSAASASSLHSPASYLAIQTRIKLREVSWRLESRRKVSPPR